MASQGTRMGTVGPPFSVTDFSTRMRSEVSIIFRVEVLSTIAVVFGHRLVVLIVALRTFPVENMKTLLHLLLIDVSDPFFDAFGMH